MAQITLKELRLRDGTLLRIRTAVERDAFETLNLYRAILNEGSYMLLEPDELQRSEDDEREAIRRELEHPGKLRVVAEVDGSVVGMARAQAGALKRTAHFAEVDSVSVHPHWRRRGIADGLMDALVRWAEAHEHIEKMGLFVFSTSKAAIRLYERHGFVIEGRCPRDIKFADGVYADTVIMGRMVG